MQRFYDRVRAWWSSVEEASRRKWYLWPLLIILDLIVHRIYSSINDFMDAHLPPMWSSVLTYLSDPLRFEIAFAILIVLIILCDAYRRSLSDVDSTSYSGRRMDDLSSEVLRSAPSVVSRKYVNKAGRFCRGWSRPLRSRRKVVASGCNAGRRSRSCPPIPSHFEMSRGELPAG